MPKAINPFEFDYNNIPDRTDRYQFTFIIILKYCDPMLDRSLMNSITLQRISLNKDMFILHGKSIKKINEYLKIGQRLKRFDKIENEIVEAYFLSDYHPYD